MPTFTHPTPPIDWRTLINTDALDDSKTLPTAQYGDALNIEQKIRPTHKGIIEYELDVLAKTNVGQALFAALQKQGDIINIQAYDRDTFLAPASHKDIGSNDLAINFGHALHMRIPIVTILAHEIAHVVRDDPKNKGIAETFIRENFALYQAEMRKNPEYKKALEPLENYEGYYNTISNIKDTAFNNMIIDYIEGIDYNGYDFSKGMSKKDKKFEKSLIADLAELYPLSIEYMYAQSNGDHDGMTHTMSEVVDALQMFEGRDVSKVSTPALRTFLDRVESYFLGNGAQYLPENATQHLQAVVAEKGERLEQYRTAAVEQFGEQLADAPLLVLLRDNLHILNRYNNDNIIGVEEYPLDVERLLSKELGLDYTPPSLP